MNHYEIVIIIHPDRSDQVQDMFDRYKNVVIEADGKVHRFENWGRRKFEYPINKIYKGHYIMFNIECSVEILVKLKKMFKFNDSVIRELILRKNSVVTGASYLASSED